MQWTQDQELASIVLSNLFVYCSCTLSVQGDHEEANALTNQLQGKRTQLSGAHKTIDMWLTFLDEDSIAKFLSHPTGKDMEFQIRRQREYRHLYLSEEEESLINALQAHGPISFGKLYTDLSTTLSCEVEIAGEKKSFGMAQAASLLESPDRSLRKALIAP